MVHGILPVASAHAEDLRCGQTVETSTVLNRDIGPCPFGAVHIGADNITLDLGGHRILGSGAGTGVLVPARSGVTIRNGTVSGFERGVSVQFGQSNRIEHLRLEGNRLGIALMPARSTTVRANVVVRNRGFGGIVVGGTFNPGSGSQGNVIENNVVEENAPHGVVVGAFSGSTRIVHNSVVRNARHGIRLEVFSRNNVVHGNFVADNGGDGVNVGLPSGDEPFDPHGGNTISFNSVYGNGANGIHVGNGENSISFNATGDNNRLPTPGQPAFDLLDSSPGNMCDMNAWFGNLYETAFPPCAAG
ncbi:MAG: right-handed parallel beta-helix repeat-containing protein [Actinomycetota bacterium]|nr:right-handed parallel beta-helix repeat-containing protein [Actinomycetota bacterium]